MSLVSPFAALRPAPGKEAKVLSPPYDVMNRGEAQEMAAGNPDSFLHISRPEIDLPESVGIHDEAVYAQASRAMSEFRESGRLLQDKNASYYVYRVEWRGMSQTGLAAAVSVASYDAGLVKKHENTRPDKEDDRVKHLIAVGGHTGPVMMFNQESGLINRLLSREVKRAPTMSAPGPHDSRHSIWVVDDQETMAAFTQAYEELGALYIADGHHRSAAASRAAAQGYGHRFLGVIFPESELRILDYNRVIIDLGDYSANDFLNAVGEKFEVDTAAGPVLPVDPGTFGLYIEQQWYVLTLKAKIPDHPTKGLDATLLEDHLLAPILDIQNVRTDSRIDFVGGIRGAQGLEERVAVDAKAAVTVPPVSMEALRRVADAGEIMPPKSTWFEPKLADGLVSLLL